MRIERVKRALGELIKLTELMISLLFVAGSERYFCPFAGRRHASTRAERWRRSNRGEV
jgi:hypothetical protein